MVFRAPSRSCHVSNHAYKFDRGIVFNEVYGALTVNRDTMRRLANDMHAPCPTY